MVHLKSRTFYGLEREEPERVAPGPWAGGRAMLGSAFVLDKKDLRYFSEVIILFMNIPDSPYFLNINSYPLVL